MSIPVFSLFPYSKKGEAQQIEIMREIVSLVKNCRLRFLDDYLSNKITYDNREKLEEFITSESVLIPIPRSAPLVTNAQWPSRDICDILISKGIGLIQLPLLTRNKAVSKAALQKNSADRPSVKTHYESLAVIQPTIFETEIKEII